MAAHIKRLREGHRHSLLLSVGISVGGRLKRPHFTGQGGTIPVGSHRIAGRRGLYQRTDVDSGRSVIHGFAYRVREPLCEGAAGAGGRDHHCACSRRRLGGQQCPRFNGCARPWGPAFEFAKEASPAIDVILTGHWHAALIAPSRIRPAIPDRL